VQVNYLGYPGTCGASWWDYIIADDFVLPPDQEGYYAERPARLPHSFQVNDARRLPSQNGALTRAACGLPEEAVVLCAFSNSYKLNPAQFALWARVLRAAPQAVLWLLADNPAVSARLRAHAVREGVAPERLLFAPRLPYAQHLARLALADLLLDTLPFNAGATASDALWLGVPVLTCPGQAFASRMAGSLLRAAGLPELIASSPADYEALAISLANDPNALQTLKAKLVAQRATQPFFDGARYCRHLEQAYRLMARPSPIDAPRSLVSVSSTYLASSAAKEV
jgi:predicted O-linked N-acetylglucosamine transferase (SPINDLY family)